MKKRNLLPSFKKWENVGDSLCGVLVSIDEQEGAGNKSYNLYKIRTGEGEIVKFALGSCMDRDLSGSLEVGKEYEFVYEGKVEVANRRTMNTFAVAELVEDGHGDTKPKTTAEQTKKDSK